MFFLLFIAPQIPVCKFERRSKVEWLRRKPHWSLDKSLEVSRHQIKHLFTFFSNNLLSVLISDIGP